MLLQSLTGLSDADDIHRYLGIVDKFLGNDFDWSETNLHLTASDLVTGIWFYLGHPAKYPTVEDYCLDHFEAWLQEKQEIILADIVAKLRRRIGTDTLDNYGVRIVVMWLFANLDYLKEKYLETTKRKYRQISSQWTPSQK